MTLAGQGRVADAATADDVELAHYRRYCGYGYGGYRPYYGGGYGYRPYHGGYYGGHYGHCHRFAADGDDVQAPAQHLNAPRPAPVVAAASHPAPRAATAPGTFNYDGGPAVPVPVPSTSPVPKPGPATT
ncbi:MAG: hypothetical protein K2P78_04365, partial [Gemmataceae bacterium]|nr:hypothetical protein [Gemmataceae bacterium]